MNPDDWKEFLNGLFVNADGSRKSAVVSLTLEVGEGKLTLPGVEIAHTDTLQQVFLKVDRLFAQSTNSDAAGEQEENLTDRIKPVNVEHIQHGNTEYIVYRMSDESFRVAKPNGEVVTPKTIVYNTVVKKYREKFNLD